MKEKLHWKSNIDWEKTENDLKTQEVKHSIIES
jgi:hypothetical protein